MRDNKDMIIETLWHNGRAYKYYEEITDVFDAWENVLKITEQDDFYLVYIYNVELDPKYEEKDRTHFEWLEYTKHFNEIIGKVTANKLIKIKASEVSKIEYRIK